MSFQNTGLFFGQTVSKSSPLVYEDVPEGFLVTAAVLGPENAKQKRSVLMGKVGGNANIALASLVPGQTENVGLSLMFEKGVKVVFSVEGPGIIHISGRYLFDGEYGDMDMGGVPQEIDMESSSSSSQPIEMDAGQYEEEDSSSSSSSIPEKKRPAPQEVEESESSEPKPKAVFKGKQQQAEEDSSSEVKEVKKRRRAKGDESDLEVQHMSIRGEDLQFIDLCKGGGKSVRKGNKIRVRYTGRFANSNKIFDTSGRKCFSFTAGKGEVIQGFDAGMKGMMPGGKRKIFIPSELAYGAEGALPDIPAHSDLIFEVEMVGFGSGTGKKKARNQKRQSSPPRLGY